MFEPFDPTVSSRLFNLFSISYFRNLPFSFQASHMPWSVQIFFKLVLYISVARSHFDEPEVDL